MRSFNAPIPRIVVEKEKPEPRGSGSRELISLSSYKTILASHALEVNVTEGDKHPTRIVATYDGSPGSTV